MDLMPNEILDKVFRFLSFEDRKNFALVCKRWNDVYNRTFLLNEEVLVFHGGYDAADVAALLVNSKRVVLNLAFHGLRFSQQTDYFWEQCGKKIRSLKLVNCAFDVGASLEKVIVCCDQLTHIVLKLYDPTPATFQTFGNLIAKGVIRESLHFFSIYLWSSDWITKYNLPEIFKIFPKIKSLEIDCYTIENCCAKPAKKALFRSNTKTNSRFQCMLRNINRLNRQIEYLKLDLGHYAEPSVLVLDFVYDVFQVVPKLKKLKKFSFLMSDPRSDVSCIRSVSKLKHLTSLDFVCSDRTQFETPDFELKILNKLILLRHLKLSNSKVDEAFFVKLIESNLETLVLENIYVESMLDIRSSHSDVIGRNFSLRDLTLNIDFYNNVDKVRPFLVYFRNLRHLSINKCTDSVFNWIFKYQINLKSLVAIDCHMCTDIGFCGKKPQTVTRSLGNLKRLEHLTLDLSDYSCKVSSKTFSTFLLPSIKYLNSLVCLENEFNHMADISVLIQCIQSNQQLEGLKIHWELDVPFAICLELCSKLKNLRYLHVVDITFMFSAKFRFESSTLRPVIKCESFSSETFIFKNNRFADSEYETLFNVRPSLRVFVHNGGSFFYDVFKKKVTEKKQNIEYVLHSYKIGSYRVNWMRY